jgi:hypothetical protein
MSAFQPDALFEAKAGTRNQPSLEIDQAHKAAMSNPQSSENEPVWGRGESLSVQVEVSECVQI